MTTVRVPGFSPSTAGLHFPNRFPHEPIAEFQLGSIATLTVGDAANGLCGGMSFTTADLRAAGIAPPPDTTPPAGDTAPYHYIAGRQVDSFEMGAVPLRFYGLMSPSRPDRDSAVSGLLVRLGLRLHSRTWVMLHDEWPKVRADLDGGRLSPIGLVRVVSADPGQLTHNHQVLAWGYDLDGAALSIFIYDPNWPDQDGVRLILEVTDPTARSTPTYVLSDGRPNPDGPVLCFFRAPYEPKDPAPWR